MEDKLAAVGNVSLNSKGEYRNNDGATGMLVAIILPSCCRDNECCVIFLLNNLFHVTRRKIYDLKIHR